MLSHAVMLRRRLSELNRDFAQRHALPCKESYGMPPTIAYEPDAVAVRHGNFLESSYRAILANASWQRRFNKVHSQGKSLPAPSHGCWRELDSCNSSDALLMNVFCYPRITSRKPLQRLLGLPGAGELQFGFKARVPLANGRSDQTEVDLRIFDLLIEAKLTESDFQNKAKGMVEGYRDLAAVFDRRLLPQTETTYRSYQLIRNVLAAAATGARFCVLLDARRPDLIESWHLVQRAIRPTELRVRCSVLTWQELASALPRGLAAFLAEKYGIVPIQRG